MAGFTSHDVRKMHICSECGKLGVVGHELATRLDAPAILQTGQGRSKKFTHPRCMRVEHLVLLSMDQLGEVRLCDVSERTMETILLTLANRSGSEHPELT